MIGCGQRGVSILCEDTLARWCKVPENVLLIAQEPTASTLLRSPWPSQKPFKSLSIVMYIRLCNDDMAHDFLWAMQK